MGSFDKNFCDMTIGELAKLHESAQKILEENDGKE
jgi:hypothetical protein